MFVTNGVNIKLLQMTENVVSALYKWKPMLNIIDFFCTFDITLSKIQRIL